jgi:protein TonB
MVLHILAFALTLLVVNEAAAPVPPDDVAISMVFAPPSIPEQPADAPAAAVEPPPPAVTQESEEPPIEQPFMPAAPMPEAPEPPPAPPRTAQEAPKPPPAINRPAARVKPAPPSRTAPTPGPAAPVSAVPAPAQQAAEAPIPADWQQSIAAWLAAHKTYPDLARRRGVEGNVVLRFTAARSGRVLEVSVEHSSGSDMLDHAAEALVRNATLPAFAAGMARDTATVTVTIRYALAH